MKFSAFTIVLAMAAAPLMAADWVPGVTPETIAAVPPAPAAAPLRLSPRDGQNYSGAEEMLVMEFSLPSISLDIPEAEVVHQLKNYPGQVGFDNALRQALGSFLNDYSDRTGPLARTLQTIGSASGKPSKTDLVTARKQLAERLNSPDAFIALVRPYRSYQPRNGEKVEQNWIFFLRLGDSSYWAVVDRSGAKPAYNYGIN
jgi:hypothetical protein